MGDNMKERFSGLYFKNVCSEGTISFIPGVCKDHSFIQIIETFTNNSYYVKYPLESYSYDSKNKTLTIDNNVFSPAGISVHIEDEIKLDGELEFTNMSEYQKTLYAPTIMGPLTYLPFDCKHLIISMRHQVDGYLNLNDCNINFDRGNGYIEGDSGSTFPNKYLWLQGNDLEDSFVIAIANVKNKLFNFDGFFMLLDNNGEQIRFSTYDLGTVDRVLKKENKIDIRVIEGGREAYITIYPNYSNTLKAPVKGNMTDNVNESLTTRARVLVKKKGKKIFEKEFSRCGFEITDNF